MGLVEVGKGREYEDIGTSVNNKNKKRLFFTFLSYDYKLSYLNSQS